MVFKKRSSVAPITSSILVCVMLLASCSPSIRGFARAQVDGIVTKIANPPTSAVMATIDQYHSPGSDDRCQFEDKMQIVGANLTRAQIITYFETILGTEYAKMEFPNGVGWSGPPGFLSTVVSVEFSGPLLEGSGPSGAAFRLAQQRFTTAYGLYVQVGRCWGE